jgi:hypothetical protein
VSALPASFLRHAEYAFGTDFGHVRIHESDLPRSIGTIACTRGSDIHFVPGAYDPGSPRGREIICHELAHVLQQRAGQPGIRSASRLEADAVAAAWLAAAGRRVPAPQAGRLAAEQAVPPVLQGYTLLPPGALFAFPGGAPAAAAAAVVNPQSTVVTAPGDTFIGQVKGAGSRIPTSFLNAAFAPNLASVAPGATPLRVAQNGKMAIEHADLSVRQPKAFYATQDVVNASNQRLQLFGSTFRLVPDPTGAAQQIIRIGPRNLIRVMPSNTQNASAGLAMTANQSCDEFSERVAGAPGLVPYLPGGLHPAPTLATIEYNVARELCLPVPPPLDYTTPLQAGTTMTAIATPYGGLASAPSPAFTALVQGNGLNAQAAPAVADAFVVCSLIAVPVNGRVTQGGEPPTVMDYYRPVGLGMPAVIDRARTWGSHWGGVVAVDGDDVITLENYARNAEDPDRPLGDSSLHYFQMYHVGGPDSWHDQWTNTIMAPFAGAAPGGVYRTANQAPVSPGARSLYNPITMRMTVPTARYDAIAATRYNGVNLDTIKDTFNMLALATTPAEELDRVLAGLQYANSHLAADRPGRAPRVASWQAELTAAQGLARFNHANGPVIAYTLGKINRMRTH